MEKEQCKNCPIPEDKTKIIKNLWKEGESKYKWNRAGTLKDYQYICEVCGYEQHYLNL